MLETAVSAQCRRLLIRYLFLLEELIEQNTGGKIGEFLGVAMGLAAKAGEVNSEAVVVAINGEGVGLALQVSGALALRSPSVHPQTFLAPAPSSPASPPTAPSPRATCGHRKASSAANSPAPPTSPPKPPSSSTKMILSAGECSPRLQGTPGNPRMEEKRMRRK